MPKNSMTSFMDDPHWILIINLVSLLYLLVHKLTNISEISFSMKLIAMLSYYFSNESKTNVLVTRVKHLKSQITFKSIKHESYPKPWYIFI